MASYYKIFYEVSGESGEEVSWVEKDNPENVDFLLHYPMTYKN